MKLRRAEVGSLNSHLPRGICAKLMTKYRVSLTRTWKSVTECLLALTWIKQSFFLQRCHRAAAPKSCLLHNILQKRWPEFEKHYHIFANFAAAAWRSVGAIQFCNKGDKWKDNIAASLQIVLAIYDDRSIVWSPKLIACQAIIWFLLPTHWPDWAWNFWSLECEFAAVSLNPVKQFRHSTVCRMNDDTGTSSIIYSR